MTYSQENSTALPGVHHPRSCHGSDWFRERIALVGEAHKRIRESFLFAGMLFCSGSLAGKCGIYILPKGFSVLSTFYSENRWALGVVIHENWNHSGPH